MKMTILALNARRAVSFCPALKGCDIVVSQHLCLIFRSDALMSDLSLRGLNWSSEEETETKVIGRI